MARKRRQRSAAASGAPFPISFASAVSPAPCEQQSNSASRRGTKCRESGDACCVSPHRSPNPEPPSLSHLEALRAAHSHASTGGSCAMHREEPSVVGMEDFPSPMPCLRRVASSDGCLYARKHGKSFPVSDRQVTGCASVGITAMQDVAYCRNWSQMVIGATSAIMFLIVVCVGYALYILVTPYGQSIMNGVLLSIVMHPQNRLRSPLYMGTAVDRMARMQQRWGVRGRLMAFIGSWLSLCHFASFVVMQGTFFLGLNKIHVHAQSVLLGAASADGQGAGKDIKRASATTMPRCPCGSRGVISPAMRLVASTALQGGATGVCPPEAVSASSRTASGTHPSPNAPPSQLHRRLVSTPRGRRVLRWLTVSVIVLVAHLLVGVTYFALLHAALGAVFVITVPFLSADAFVSSMGQLWRVAVFLFFAVGLTLNLTADVLCISEAVRRTTSAVVGGGGGGAENAATAALSASNVCDGFVAALGVENCTPTAPSVKMAVASGDIASGEDAACDATEAATSTVDADALSVLAEHRSRIEAFLIGKIQDLVVQELADMLSDGNVSKMIDTLMEVLPPQLRSVVTRDDAALAIVEQSANKTNSSLLVGGEGSTHGNVGAQPLSWRAVLENARGLRPASALKFLVYHSLSGTSVRTLDGENGTSVSGTTAAGHKTEIEWLTVSRLIASRLLPYVEHALRLLVRVGSNLLGLFDSLYAVMLFGLCYRYFTQLEHTVLYYGLAKLLRVMQPEMGDYHARSIEQDITVSLITLLQSFWHLTWFHFCITFCVFKLWGFPTPFLLGLVSVALALFPLVPKWLSPCSVALVYMLVQLALLMTSEGTSFIGNSRSRETYGTAATDAPLFSFPPGQSWIEAFEWCKPHALRYARALSFGLAVLLECGDEWLLCVSRGLRGGFFTEADEKGREQLQPFVIGTALVLGFVAYGTRGIGFGPLTIIVARVLFDNWDVVLVNRAPGHVALPPPSFMGVKGEDDEEETAMVESP
ncbi:hypothetical predicted multi-pass transmembrane protein [Leishmania tarentolae]|uniref:Hypothetical predicted multi-pass transmembrane protein n=1 Tax=Leishmania tarentolae TaxID=5689 RepID=A0A640KHX5_LEITA|nr:hypothetical predicted multi-pass transmembrane protein [Leishmania tarentolae]